MKKIYITLLLMTSIFYGFCQQSTGFNYQSVIRDADGSILVNTEIDILIKIVQSTNTGTNVYTETHQATTNAFGLVNLVIGQGTLVSGDFATINWGADNYFLNVEIDVNNSGTFTEIGTTQLLSVPYANYAFTSGSSNSGWVGSDQSVSTSKNVGIGTDAPTSKLQIVANENQKSDEPIFEIKNAAGKTVFAVFENEVKVYIDDATPSPGFTVNKRDAADQTEEIMAVGPQQTNVYVGAGTGKGVLGGFAVSGRTTTKAVENLFTITPDMTQFFVKEPAGKESFGGFAVSGRTTTKGIVDILSITPSLTEFFVDQPAKESFGGFAVSGRTTTKGVTENLLNITPALTKFTVEQPAKENFGGFAVSGRTTTKAEVDILNITPDFTRFYIDEPNTKENFGGFAVSGRTTTKGINDEIFKVTPGLTEVFVNESLVKESFGGFAVSGRTTTKETGLFDIFKVQPHKTEVYIKDSETKNLPEGFSIFSLNPALESTELFAVTEGGTFVNTTMAIAPKVTTFDASEITQTEALAGGTVTDSSNLVIIKVGVIYSLTPNPSLNIDTSNTAIAGIVFGDAGNPSDFSGLLMTNLTPNQTYYYRAFATNNEGLTGYGETKSFQTLNYFTFEFDPRDALNENPISNATISIFRIDIPNADTITNEPGNYLFNVVMGSYGYKAYAPLSYPTEGEFSVTQPYESLYLILEDLEPSVIRFEVSDVLGQPIENASIDLTNEFDYNEFAYTNEAGFSEVTLTVGDWNFTAYKDEFYLDSLGLFTVESATAQTIPITLRYSNPHTLSVNVINQSSAPVTNASVEIYREEFGVVVYYQTKTTDAAGNIVFENIPDGTYSYDASHATEGSDSGSFTITTDDNLLITLGY